MGEMFVGLLFLSIDINIGPMSMTPNFIGYLLLNHGMGRADGKAQALRKRRDLLLYLIPVGMIEFVVTIMGLANVVTMVLFLAAKMAALWAVASWAGMLEEDSAYDLGAAKVMSAWKLVLIANVVAALTLWIPIVAMAATIVALIAMIYYLVMFWKYKKNWEEDQMERNEESV